MSDFLRGQSSKIITKLSEEDEAAFVLKNGRPMAVLISIDRYERLMKAGIDITEY
nr:type II toxin-antitoxin system prevent-host-death family antitoxin [Corynebacterium marambiense]